MSSPVSAAARSFVLGSAVAVREAARGVRSGLQLLREASGPGGIDAASRRATLQAELEQARRLGRWHTAEDEALLREHEARLAAEQRAAGLRQAGRRGSMVLLVLAWFVPILWPLAIAGSVAAFPRTSRRLALGFVALVAVAVLGVSLLVGQLLRGDAPPAVPESSTAPLIEDRSATLGRRIAERLQREADYWEMERSSGEGPAMLRKGLYREWGGRPVMVLPRSSWAGLTPAERRALADHVRFERGVSEIHIGRIVSSSRFEGNEIRPEQRVWP
jgi:hypothetical protein